MGGVCSEILKGLEWSSEVPDIRLHAEDIEIEVIGRGPRPKAK